MIRVNKRERKLTRNQKKEENEKEKGMKGDEEEQ